MALVKPYAELTHADKIYLLHSLFPQDIKAVLIFIADRIELLLQQPDKIMIDWEINEGPSWTDILASLSQHIQVRFDELVENKYRFVNTFSKGYNQFFFLDCITVYSCLCKNGNFRKALEFFFDL